MRLPKKSEVDSAKRLWDAGTDTPRVIEKPTEKKEKIEKNILNTPFVHPHLLLSEVDSANASGTQTLTHTEGDRTPGMFQHPPTHIID